MVQNGSKTDHLEHLVSLGAEILQNDGVPGVFKYTLPIFGFPSLFQRPPPRVWGIPGLFQRTPPRVWDLPGLF